MHASASTPASSAAARIGVAALLTLQAGLLLWTNRSSAITFDEYAHLPAGVAYWRHGALDIYNLTPPLLRFWAAAPLLAMDPQVPDPALVRADSADARHWIYAEHFLRANAETDTGRYVQFFTVGRAALIPLLLFGGWVVYRWAAALHGEMAGLAALALYVTCPNLIAHGALLTTDAGTSVAILAAAWLAWRFGAQPTLLRGVLLALAIAAAHLCKFTALLLWPALLAMLSLQARGAGWRGLARRWLGLFAAAAATWLIVNAVYGFAGVGRPLSELEFESQLLIGVARQFPWLPSPLASDVLIGFDVQKFETEGQYPALLLGEVYSGSRWYFYPVALALKLPLATLALLALSAVTAVTPGRQAGRLDRAVPLLFASILLAGMTLGTQINIGIRYILPILPLLYVALGGLWRAAADSGGRWRSRAATVLLALAALEPLAQAPHYLAFMNALGGGPAKAYRQLNDSNYDWGQDLDKLGVWMRENRQEQVVLCYFGSVDPRVYGVAYSSLLEPDDTSEYVVVSSYFVAGLDHWLRTPRGRSEQRVSLPYHRELANLAPAARLGRTLFVYRRGEYEQLVVDFFSRSGTP